jgi:hypothetical protein
LSRKTNLGGKMDRKTSEKIVADAELACQAVREGLAEWRPDYSDWRKGFDLLKPPEYDGIRYYEGALAVLSILGGDETYTNEQIINLARHLTHECKYHLQTN